MYADIKVFQIRAYFEPTSALDPEMIKEVFDVMIELADEGMEMICVTRELSFVKTVVDRVIFMEGGEIIEENNTHESFCRFIERAYATIIRCNNRALDRLEPNTK